MSISDAKREKIAWQIADYVCKEINPSCAGCSVSDGHNDAVCDIELQEKISNIIKENLEG